MMRTKNVIVFLLSTTLVMASGCSVSQTSPEMASFFDFDYEPPSNFVARRFEDTTATGATKMESTIELTEKYAKLTEEVVGLRQEKLRLAAENQQLKKDLTGVDLQLNQAQKELGDANTLLREMVIELNNWKSNVMGFRDEMRDADKAQLEALLKILQALGGDVIEQVAEAANIKPTMAHAAVVNTPPSQQTSITGEVDE